MPQLRADDRRPGPEPVTGGGAEGTHAGELIGQRVAGDAPGLEQHVMLRRVAEERAEDVGVVLPDSRAGLQVEGDQDRLVVRFLAARGRWAVNGIDAAAAGADGVVA